MKKVLFLTIVNDYTHTNVNYYKTKKEALKLFRRIVENPQKQCNREASFTGFSTIC